MNLNGRSVAMFRCVLDPMVGPKPKQAFVPKECAMEAHIIEKGVYVKVLPHGTFGGSEHIIPFTNISSIRLDPLPSIDNVSQLEEAKRKPGRPVGS